MAHKKAGGSSRNGRDSESKRLGVKKFGGEAARAGNIIVRQRGTQVAPGRQRRHGQGPHLFALTDGRVAFRDGKLGRKYVHVMPMPEANEIGTVDKGLFPQGGGPDEIRPGSRPQGRRGKPPLLPFSFASSPETVTERRYGPPAEGEETMFARTARLLLRPGWAEDAPALAAAIADELIVRNLATAPWPYRLRDAEAFLAQPRDPVLPSFLIFERTDGAPRLRRLVRPWPAASGAVELGYWIARPYWGRGYRDRGVRALIDIARTLRPAAARRLALPRQSGVRPGA